MLRIVAIGASALLVIGSLLGAELYADHRQIEQRETDRLTSLASALNSNIGEQLRTSASMLNAVGEDADDLAQSQIGSERLSHRMKILSESLMGVSALLYVNAQGDVVASNQPSLIGRNFRDSDRYKALSERNNPAILHVSAPFTTPLGRYTIALGKGLQNRAGKFNGYLLAIIDPDYFGVLLKSLQYSPDMRLSVAHGNGRIIYSTQTSPDIRGRDLTVRPDSMFLRHLRSGAPSSFAIDHATVTRDLRLVAIHTVYPTSGEADNPLVIAVSRDAETVFADWRRSAITLGGLYAIGVIGTLLTLHVSQRRKRAFQDLREEKDAASRLADKQIEAKHEQFRAYFNTMAVGAVQLDASGRFELVNDRYCEITGYSPDELIGRMKPSEMTHPDDAEAEQAQIHSVEQGDADTREIEKRIVRKDGRTIWVHVSSHVVRNENGTVKFTSAVVEDIAHRKHLMRELADAKEHAEAANRAKTLFLGNMSHEVRTPLHQIAGVASMFRRDVTNEKQQRRTVMLDAAVKRLDAVISGILTLVDLEAGSASVRLAPVNVVQLVDDAVALAVVRASTKGLHIEHTVAELPSPLYGAADHITTILACFCNNAITFSEKGTIRIRVELIHDEAGYVQIRISVKDEGIGIAAKDIPRLFEHFEQADNSNTRRYGGTGVGLAIVKKLAHLMGGDAGCNSTPGEGSTFWATLTLVKRPQEEARLHNCSPDDYQI